MKNYLKLSFCLGLVAAFFVISCQKEEHESYVNPGALNKSSELTTLLKRVALANAVDDNTIDSASCFKIKLPVELTVNNQFLLVSDESGYQQAADIFNAGTIDMDHLEYGFPITIVYPNGQEIAVGDIYQYQDLRNTCRVESSEVPIGCIDLVFPFSVSIYDTNSQTPQIVSIENSFDLLAFIVNLGGGQYFDINYPISAVVDGGTVAINNNAELLGYINIAITNCIGCDNPHILTNDLVMYIPFANETKDLTGFATPVVQGAHHYVTDRSGNANGAISFDAGNKSNRIDVPGNLNNNMLQNGQFTISLWFNRQNAAATDEMEGMYNTSEMSIQLGNIFNMEIRSPVVIAPGLVDPLYDIQWINNGMLGEVNIWHHIVLTFTDGVLSLYRDGALVNQAFGIEFVGVLAGGDFGYQFKGYMDDIRIYKKALTLSEVQLLNSMDGDINHCLN